MMRKISTDKFRREYPKGATNAGEVGKHCVFRPVEKSPAQTPYNGRKFVSITVIRVHDGALADVAE